MKYQTGVVVLILALGVLSFRSAEARRVHGFDCSLCHQGVSSDPVPYMTYNLCLSCHAPGNANTYELTDGGTSNPVTGTFASGDASDAMGSYPDGVTPGDQTSHFWAGSDD
ncbi:MAG: hypothetical protein P8X63_14260, partial [Desulfuromonadaceae bacterium]